MVVRVLRREWGDEGVGRFDGREEMVVEVGWGG